MVSHRSTCAPLHQSGSSYMIVLHLYLTKLKFKSVEYTARNETCWNILLFFWFIYIFPPSPPGAQQRSESWLALQCWLFCDRSSLSFFLPLLPTTFKGESCHRLQLRNFGESAGIAMDWRKKAWEGKGKMSERTYSCIVLVISLMFWHLCFHLVLFCGCFNPEEKTKSKQSTKTNKTEISKPVCYLLRNL